MNINFKMDHFIKPKPLQWCHFFKTKATCQILRRLKESKLWEIKINLATN